MILGDDKDTKEAVDAVDSSEGLYGASDEIIREVAHYLEIENYKGVWDLIDPLHAADLAQVLETLSATQRGELIEHVNLSKKPDILSELEPAIRDEIIEYLGIDKISKILSKLDRDEAEHFVEDLPEDFQDNLLKAVSKKDRAKYEERLAYPEESAGRIMMREYVMVPSIWTVAKTTEFLRSEKDLPESFTEVIVVDPLERPVGILYVSDLLRNPAKTKISAIMESEIKSVPATTDQEDVAHLFQHYDLAIAPVVDEDGVMLGVISTEEIIHIIGEEASEDILHLGGVTESDFHATPFVTWYQRVGWLVVTLLNSLLTVLVVAEFESSFQAMPVLAALMPLAASMGGSAGMQVMTVTVRAIVTRELTAVNMPRSLTKEIFVGMMHGLFFTLWIMALVTLWYLIKGDGLNEGIMISILLSIALFFNMVWASVAGVILPIFVDKMGYDPAVSVGPVLTTTTDVLGYAAFLGLATAFLL